MTFSQTLLLEFDEEMKNTRKLLGCVPDGKFDYQPHPKSMTLGRLASHVADLPSQVTRVLDQEVFDLQPGYKPWIGATRAELLEMFDKCVTESRAKIAAATDQEWAKTWTFKFAGKAVFSNPRSAVVRGTVMNHLIHHRAQLGVFLRLNDVEIPGMYGPSADEMKFWQTQSA
jgi:uncharacterized damage-inducible protein DinB